MTAVWSRRIALAVLGGVLAAGVGRADYINRITTPGDATDLAPGTTPNENRLGGQFSDLYFDRSANVYYALPDRGPGGGLVPYETRVQQFTLDVDPTSGAISNFKLTKTIKFKTADGKQAFNGLNPGLLNGDKSKLGRSFDPEGFVVAKNGNFFVADEYGPSVYEFRPVVTKTGETEARFVRALGPPSNLLPKQPDGTTNFVDGRPTITTGRQDNRGFEGLAVTPDGSKLYAVLQDPLVNEGVNPANPSAVAEGRRSRNVRIVEFDAATGLPGRQFIYQLESVDDINARIPGTANDFGATAQGRNIGVSAIIALNDTEFLVIERDNRGVGVEDALGANPVGSKRVFQIDISGASDVAAVDLTGTNDLPPGVTPVSKSLLLDIQAALTSAGVTVREKFEGLAVGPQLTNGDYAFLVGIDNDLSVTQIPDTGAQFDVYTDGTSVLYTPLGDPTKSFASTAAGSPDLGRLPAGFELLPSELYAFGLGLPTFVPQAVPEPASLGLLAVGAAGLALRARRRR